MAKSKMEIREAVYVQKSTEKIRRCIRNGCAKEFMSKDAGERVCPGCRSSKNAKRLGQPKQGRITTGSRVREE